MKKIKLTMVLTVSDEFFNGKQMQEMKNEILSGKYQRDILTGYQYKHSDKDVSKCTVTLEEIK